MAYNGKTVSLGLVLWEIMRNPLANDLEYADAASYALSFLRLLGAPVIRTNKITDPKDTEIVEYRCKLPEDLYKIVGVKYLVNADDGNDLANGKAMQKSTDVYHNANLPEGTDTEYQGFTYIVEGNYIKTSIEEGFLMISYEAFSQDENGFPMIPDDERTIEGLKYFILHKHIEPLWMVGKVSDKAFRYVETKKLFYLPSAASSLRMPDADELESIMNGINKIIMTPNAHRDGFRNYGEKEYLKYYR